jgi:hypothetical protein
MKVVHVLRNEERELAYLLELDDGVMSGVRIDEVPWLARKRRRKSLVTSRPQAVGTPKIGQTRFGADPRTGEHHKGAGLEHELGQCLYAFVEVVPFHGL